ncbi:winged helix-turn-helix domain-containing protein [Shewanella fidelis]|uniref:Helix-turn-helix domain-containing protein n=1 Tax=Shewanella fidelis TaxID=173509 RepID=A0AAW8NKY4_9GAMM|nr:helix-turn-helix domain-containing protein [Shewanella fidelis]MDR8522459.1 helix-turn-helix domain-containing protein [Shewanella fidelis]MDW4813007.1 helix-turn-helix domain-containing protein [Shewanella fidelis]MDW4816734.1 helix-turn-helix domain-containing protein [Shewanella fidelis]MDW4821014.1 helix-turn-helix domain-containing protein [Shewanella fidelis]MDW4825451.1 helix-turn-helix domain-containing protein [Shewanella fidelis]
MLTRLIFNKQTRKLTNELTSESSVNQLSLSEVKILESLIEEKAGCSRETLLTVAWQGRVVTGTSLNVAINNIRKLTKEVDGPNPIDAIRGFGYKLSDQIMFTMNDTAANIQAKSSLSDQTKSAISKQPVVAISPTNLPLLVVNIGMLIVIINLIKLYLKS